MKNCIFDKDTGHTNHQIRTSPLCLYSSLLVSVGFFFAAVLFRPDRWIFIGASLLALLYCFLSSRNDRVTYDETGITMYSILGKSFKLDWACILSIDVVEEPLISKQLFVGRVLRIKCMEKADSSITFYRFPYRYYIGIDDFLSFSAFYLPGGYDQSIE